MLLVTNLTGQTGKYHLTSKNDQLFYMPHCPRALYESFLQFNFGPSISQPGWLLLGNDLSEYLSSPSRPNDDEGLEGGFSKPKKKRKNKGNSARPIVDGVLQRLGAWSSCRMPSDRS